jgi:hypothetical protein
MDGFFYDFNRAAREARGTVLKELRRAAQLLNLSGVSIPNLR